MNTFKVISPADSSVYCQRYYASSKQIEEVLKVSIQTQVEWSATPIVERAKLCKDALAYFLDNAEEIGKEISWQMGRPIRYSPLEITKSFKERVNYMIEIAEQALQEKIVEKSSSFFRSIKKIPLGTVLVISPWNYPYLTSVNVVIPALMAGNSVILKHSIQTPLCAERYQKAFQYANLPEGIFQYLHLNHNQVSKLIEDNRINYVAFTGSAEGGKKVEKASRTRFIYTGLELGGKDPAYVCEDAKMEQTVEDLVDGSFFNSGQSCCGIERIYVHNSIYSKFLEAFVSKTEVYKLGHPLDYHSTLGPMVKHSATRFVQDQMKEALSKGAKALIDPKIFPAHDPETCYLAPQVLTGVNHRMRLMTEESFGPIVGIMEVENDGQAIHLMNDSNYGLTASVWTTDPDRANKIANQLTTGTVYMNRCDYLDPALAWTGIKDSGKGCSLSQFGYDSLTRLKSYHFNLSY